MRGMMSIKYLWYFLSSLAIRRFSNVLKESRNQIETSLVVNQSGYEPLNLENGSFVNSDVQVLCHRLAQTGPKVKSAYKTVKADTAKTSGAY